MAEWEVGNKDVGKGRLITFLLEPDEAAAFLKMCERETRTPEQQAKHEVIYAMVRRKLIKSPWDDDEKTRFSDL